MPRTSCISHPEGERLILIRKWQLEACGKDACAAALLNLFEYWHNIKLEQTSQAKSYNDIAQRHGENSSQIETLLQWHTTDQLESSLLQIFNKRRIQGGIEVLERLNFISVHRNPNPRYAFDKTKHFLFNPHEVCNWLKKHSLNRGNLQADESETSVSNASTEQNDVIDSADLYLSIGENGNNDNHKNTLPLVDPASAVGANCIEQYTKNTSQDYIQKLQPKTQTRFTYTQDKSSSLAFNLFWEKWVDLTKKPVNKNKSFEIFASLINNAEDPLLTLILRALEKQMQEKELRQKLNLFVPQWPNPSSWLGEARWEDEVYLDEDFYKAEILRSNSGLTQNKHAIKQQREYYLDGQYKSHITRIQEDRACSIGDRKDAIRQFDHEFRNRK